MNGSDSVLEPIHGTDLSGGSFQLVRRGYDPLEVQAFARAVSSELQRLAGENAELRRDLRNASVAHEPLDENSVAQYLGTETTRLLQAARDTATGIAQRAELRADEVLATAEVDARRVREAAVADAAQERRVASDEARKLIADATQHRRTTLSELARRRDSANTQIRELIRGRDVLLQALKDVAASASEQVQRLESINVSPGDFVNLDPSVQDLDAGTDTEAVLQVQLAPPTAPGTAVETDDDDDDGGAVFVLRG